MTFALASLILVLAQEETATDVRSRQVHAQQPPQVVQLVESHRKDGKIRQRIVRHIGIAMDEDELQRLRDLGEYVKVKLEAESQPTLFPAEDLAQMAIEARKHSEAQDNQPLNVNLKKLREQQRVVTGPHEVFGEIYRELGFDKLMGARRKAAGRNLFHTVMGRLANPQSKRATVAALEAGFRGASEPAERLPHDGLGR